MSCTNRTVEIIEAELILVNASILKTLQAEEYDFNTNQTRQRVKRTNLKDLQAYKQALLSELSIACSKRNKTQLTRGFTC